MLRIIFSNSFKRDYKKIKKNKKAVSAFSEVVTELQKENKLSEKYRPHALKGKFEGIMECH